MITHYDLFAGIGGFSLALEEVFNDTPIRHIFCEWERFPTAVLKEHWPDGEFWGDIAELVTDTERQRLQGQQPEAEAKGRHDKLNRSGSDQGLSFTIVTGGFPCQPFSHAGRRKGTADDRYQWPNMFAVIRHTKPEWVIAENVRGLVTWNEGMVLETVCADLEGEGYEVQPFIIPAVAVGAPHRRDRVWIIGHNNSNTTGKRRDDGGHPKSERHILLDEGATSEDKQEGDGRLGGDSEISKAPTDTGRKHGRQGDRSEVRPEVKEPTREERQYPSWSRNWQEVAFATCDDSVDDGLPRLVDGVPYSRPKWRKDSLKAYGNGIVPQVAIEIMKAVRSDYTA